MLCKPGGEDVIEEYKAEKSLTHRTRRQLVNILASHMTESHGRMPSRKHKEKYALGIITLFPLLKDPFSPKGYVSCVLYVLCVCKKKKRLLPENTSFTDSGFGILIQMIADDSLSK
ncbi:hypothetical protein PAMA_002006 [Pampus argenteus]